MTRPRPRSLYVDLERRHRRVREPQARDVDQHDRVVVGESGEIRRQALGDDRVDDLALGLERGHQLRGHGLVALDDQHPGLALDDGVRLGPIVLVERVAGGLDDHPEAQEAGVLGREVERDPGRARLEVHGLGAGQLAVDEQPHGGRLGDRRRDVARHVDRLAEARGRRGFEALDEDLVTAGEAGQDRLDLDPARGGERRLGLTGAGGVVAVREEDDPLLGVVGEQRAGESQGGADVGRVAHRRRRDAVDLGQVRREPLDQRVRAERDDPRHVLVLLLRQRLPEVGEGLLAAGRADRVRQVDDEHDGQPVDRQHELEPRERADQRRKQQHPDRERRASSALAQPAPRRQVERDHHRQERRQQQEGAGGVERDAHQALRPDGRDRPRRAATARRRRASVSRS